MSNRHFARSAGDPIFGLNTKSCLGPVWIAFIGFAGLLGITLSLWLIVRRQRRKKEKKAFLRSPAMLSAIDRISSEVEKAGYQGHKVDLEMMKTRTDSDEGCYTNKPISSFSSPTPAVSLPRTPVPAVCSPHPSSPVSPAPTSPPPTLSSRTTLRHNQSSPTSLWRPVYQPPTPTPNVTKNVSPNSPTSASARPTSLPGTLRPPGGLQPPTNASRQSLSSGGNRFSDISMASSVGNAQSLPVRQLFTPTSPDELSLTSIGELLVVLNSFDDEWCAVGREIPNSGGGMELGVVPLWVFLMPLEGIISERPKRTTSLGGSQ